MKKSPPKPGSGRPGHDPYLHADPIPVPDATESSTETGWALFSELSETENMRYADTVPLTAPGAAVPPLRRPGAPPVKLLAGLAKPVTIDAVLEMARQNQRVCPQQGKWHELHELLLARRRSPNAPEPMPPLSGPAWDATSELAKKMCLREQAAWAAANGCLDDLHAFMKALREEDWYHARG